MKTLFLPGNEEMGSSCNGDLPHVLDYQDPELMPGGVIKYTCSKVS
jgi:hypothetical protein